MTPEEIIAPLSPTSGQNVITELNKYGYVVVKRDDVVDMIDTISKGWYPYEDGKLENGTTGQVLCTEDFVKNFLKV